jgi:hypothetical protein
VFPIIGKGEFGIGGAYGFSLLDLIKLHELHATGSLAIPK